MVTTEQQAKEIAMMDYTAADIDAVVAEYRERRGGDAVVLLVQSMLSDAQEMLAAGLSGETVRRTLNRAKYILESVKSGR